MRDLPPPDKLYLMVLQALREYYNTDHTTGEFLDDLVQVNQAKQKERTSDPLMRRIATNEALNAAANYLEQFDQLSAQIIESRFFDRTPTMQAAIKFGLSEDQFKKRQKLAVERFRDIIYEIDTNLRGELTDRWRSQIPRIDSQIFGSSIGKTLIDEKLKSDEEPWIVVLNGLGGVGKTRRAQEIASGLIPTFRFEEYHWIQIDPESRNEKDALNAQLSRVIFQLTQKLFPSNESHKITAGDAQLRNRFKKTPMLVVIDNIEFPGELESILHAIQPYINPSKFLLTSRVKTSVFPDVYFHSINELNRENAESLVQHQASLLEIDEISQENSIWPMRFFEKIGGNPLALKLVTALASVLPVEDVFADLTEVDSQDVKSIYMNIYWKSWSSLSDQSKQLLLSLILSSSSGVLLDQMIGATKLTRSAVLNSISELDRRSLLEIFGKGAEKRYGIHRLTESFLKTKIINLPSYDE